MLPTSPCDYIPQSQVIALAKMKLDISTSNYDGFFRIEIENCLRKMYTPSIYEAQCKVVDVCENSIKIPSGTRKIMGLQFYNPNAVQTQEEGNILAANSGFYLWQGLGQYYPAYSNNFIENYFTVQDGYLYFTQDTEETLAVLWYYGFRTNEEGLTMIPDYFESCLSDYLGYSFLKKRPTHVQNNAYITRDLRNLYWRDYRAQKLQIIGSDQMEKFSEEARALRFALNKMRLNDYSWAPFFTGYMYGAAV